MRVVTARWLVRHLNYAILAAAILSAVLTPSSDPWNQILFAAPILSMYLVGIVVAWIVRPRQSGEENASDPSLGMVIAAGVLEHATRRRSRRLRLVHSRPES